MKEPPPACNETHTWDGITLTGIHNLTDKPLSAALCSLAARGLKFVPTPKSSDLKRILNAFKEWCRVLRWKHTFLGEPDTPPPKFYFRSGASGGEFSGRLEAWIKHTQATLTKYATTAVLKSKLIRPNLSAQEARALTALQNDTDIVVRPADKNLGLVMLYKSAYDAACVKTLSNAVNYTPYPDAEAALADSKRSATTMVNLFVKAAGTGKIQIPPGITKDLNNLRKYMVAPIGNAKVPQFTGLIKLHKMSTLQAEPVLRPIALAHVAANANISKVVAALFHPHIMDAYKWVLKDTYSIIRSIEAGTWTPHDIFVTGDIEGLYTNLPQDDIVESCAKFAQERNIMDAHVCRNIVRGIFNKSYVQFANQVRIQRNGIPMGNAFSPDSANLDLALRERSIFERSDLDQPSYFGRYIDDYTSIFKHTTVAKVEQFLHTLDELLGPHLHVTWQVSELSMDTLDLHVFKGPSMVHGKLDFKVHQKALNKYMYLPLGTAHHRSVHKAWIRAELIRYITHSSRVEYYDEIVALFTTRLVSRGLGIDFIKSVASTVSYTDRARYLYPTLSPSGSQPLALVLQYNSSTRTLPVSALMRKAVEGFVLDNRDLTSLFFDTRGRHRYLTAWKKGGNLGSLLCKE